MTPTMARSSAYVEGQLADSTIVQGSRNALGLPSTAIPSEAGGRETDRDMLDRVLRGLRAIEVRGEGIRRAERIEATRNRLAQALGYLLALPASQATDSVVERGVRWLTVEPRDQEWPSDRYEAGLANVLHGLLDHLNATAVAVAYAVLPASADHRSVFLELDQVVGRFCRHVARRVDDVPRLPAGDRPGFWAVQHLIEAREVHVLVTPSIDHLVPAAPHEAVGPQSEAGIRDWLAAFGVRLICKDDELALPHKARISHVPPQVS
ncbi:hypothetical protein AB0N09_30765 [Streptomyces erythrochromogenes]|uniref:hypothetical protein n=1 Tax=Streptomyces erythrochromogenes TaxID=285574 RepID=UPI003442ECD2